VGKIFPGMLIESRLDRVLAAHREGLVGEVGRKDSASVVRELPHVVLNGRHHLCGTLITWKGFAPSFADICVCGSACRVSELLMPDAFESIGLESTTIHSQVHPIVKARMQAFHPTSQKRLPAKSENHK